MVLPHKLLGPVAKIESCKVKMLASKFQTRNTNMAENSKIEWCDHTFNPWIGCQKVSPGCDHCYAEAMMDKRYGRVQRGPHGERKRTSEDNWKKPLAWAKRANGHRPRVFCASLADWLDNQVTASMAVRFRSFDRSHARTRLAPAHEAPRELREVCAVAPRQNSRQCLARRDMRGSAALRPALGNPVTTTDQRHGQIRLLRTSAWRVDQVAASTG
jgi:phage protein Gp37/Gp68